MRNFLLYYNRQNNKVVAHINQEPLSELLSDFILYTSEVSREFTSTE